MNALRRTYPDHHGSAHDHHDLDDVVARARAVLGEPAHTCPVEALAYEMGEVARQHLAADLASIRSIDPEVKRTQGALMDRLTHRLEEIQAQASHQPARTPEGALLQVAIAHSVAADMMSFAQDAEGHIHPQAEEHMQTITRCLFSVRHVLEQVAGISADDLLSNYYADNAQSPFAGVLQNGETAPRRPVVPGMVSAPEQQLAEINRDYETWTAIFHEAAIEQDRRDEQGGAGNEDPTPIETAIKQALRLRRAALRSSNGVIPTTLLGFALRARIVAGELREWWDADDMEAGELACRLLLDHLISAAGLNRIPEPDVTPEYIRTLIHKPEEA